MEPVALRAPLALACVLVLCVLSGCADDETTPREDAAVASSDGAQPADGADAGRAPPEDGGAADAASDTDKVDMSSALFVADRRIEVEVTLAPEDWRALTAEGRKLTKVLSGCERIVEFDYTTFHGSLKVDGKSVADVGVRKKGLLGSLSMVRPALRLDLDEFVDDQELLDERVITLNNSLQDRTYAHQCIAYALFERAGIKAPRCNLAHVVVNGQDLGTYVHVEAIKKQFLKRRFGNDEGDLYEGSAGDFSAERLVYLEKKTNEDEPVSPEISAMIAALAAPDDQLVAKLTPLIDIDEFMRFWATEVLISEADGYAGNQNNFYLYVHPETHRLHFIPWGKDGALAASAIPGASSQPASVFAKGLLARRLYAYAPTRSQYRATLQHLLDTIWDEAALYGELERIAALAGATGNTETLATQRTFIAERRAAIQADLDGPAPEVTPPPEVVLTCHADWVRPVRGTFNLPLGTTTEPGFGIVLDGSLELTLSKGPVASLLAFGFGAQAEAGVAFGFAITELDGSQVQVVLISQRSDLRPGDFAFHGFETFGIVLAGPDADHMAPQGFISDGTLHFDELRLGAGGIARGRFDGMFVDLPR